jgi:hypothetical protein
VRFEVLAAVKIQAEVIWFVMPRSDVVRYQTAQKISTWKDRGCSQTAAEENIPNGGGTGERKILLNKEVKFISTLHP